MIDQFTAPASEPRDTYDIALGGATWRNMSHFGRFRVTGADAPALLHHLTTNDVKGLKPGQGCNAALITNKARLLDWISIWRDAAGFLVLTSPNRREMFAPHARKFVLFRQDINIQDISDNGVFYGLFGPWTEAILDAWNLGKLWPTQLNSHHAAAFDETQAWLTRTARLPLEGVFLASPDRKGIEAVISGSGYPVCDNDTYNVLRVEAGLPAAGLELTEEINPWEAGLDDSISLHKGCYNGQEVVARLNTYQKIKQRLTGLTLADPIPMGQRRDLQAGGRNAGFITSSVESPRFGPIALAYVRGDYQEPGTILNVMGEGGAIGAAQTATVATLPWGKAVE
jgi:aminomethyltransferase